MFDIAWGEFIVIAVVALIVIGPKELPGVLRAIGQWTTKIRRMAAEFQGQFQEALREAEMADLKKEVDNLNDTARGFTSQFDDPLNFKEATKWEPKPDDPKADDAKPDDAADSTSKPTDSLSKPTPSDPPLHAEEHVEGAEETFPVAAKPPMTEQASTAPGGGNGGGTTNAAPAPPVTPPAAQPPSHEGSGQRGSEGGVHS
jgi:sec-independent protein translocase protein TatB